MADVTLKIKSKHSPPVVVEVVVDERNMMFEAARIARDGVFTETTYGWHYLPAERIDAVEIHV